MASSAEGLSSYFSVIAISAAVLATGAFFQFRERPPTPPSESAAARLAQSEYDVDNFLVTARKLLATPGFLPPLCAFVASIGVSNVVSAFIEETLREAGFVSQGTIDVVGAGFQAAIVIGGIVLGGLVDRTKQYKQVTLFCFAGSIFLLLPLVPSDMPKPLVVIALLGLGALIGPVQPINAELAVEVAYPADENSIEALQQLCGNLFSALLVPVAELAAHSELKVPGQDSSLHADTVLLGLIALGALGYFSTFDAALKRSALDCEAAATADDDIEVSGCDAVFLDDSNVK